MAIPVVKWVGGKRKLLNELVPRLPKKFHGYYEPFLGGGALFFATQPRFAYLADVNQELINLYRVIKHKPRDLINALDRMNQTEAEFYRIRDLDRLPDFSRLPDVERAARVVLINKTGFNGLWRVNRQGHVNVAWGRRKLPALLAADNVMAVHEALRRVRLAHAPFSALFDVVRRGDFVYFDPPYDGGDFVGYAAGGFTRVDQYALWQTCVKLHRMGVMWMLSNAGTALIRSLYHEFRVEIVSAPRSVGGDRQPAREVIVRNY
jgi:DNA adenine methylase